MNLKNGIKNTSKQFKIMLLLKIVALLALCRVHDFTRYKVCRSFSDLFYWPEGLCIDMFVIYGFFLIMALVIKDYAIFFAKCKTENENNTIIIMKDWLQRKG